MAEPGGGENNLNSELEVNSPIKSPEKSFEKQFQQDAQDFKEALKGLSDLKNQIVERFSDVSVNFQEAREKREVFKFLTDKPEFITFAGITLWEKAIRQPLVGREPMWTDNVSKFRDFVPPPDSALQFLNNVGDLWDGYTYSMLTYYGISMLNHPFPKKIPEEIKVGISFLIGAAVVVGAETGILKNGTLNIPNTPDYGDIPAGIVGAVAFAGIKMLNKDFIDKCTDSIKKIRDEIRNSPAEKQNAEFLKDFDEDEQYYEDFTYAAASSTNLE